MALEEAEGMESLREPLPAFQFHSTGEKYQVETEEPLEGFQVRSDIHVSEPAFAYNKGMVWDWRNGGKTGSPAPHSLFYQPARSMS